MNTRNMLTGFFLVLAVLTEGAIALSSTKGNNSVTVLARGPAGLRIEGKGSEVSLEEDDSALTFKVPLAPTRPASACGTCTCTRCWRQTNTRPRLCGYRAP